jgi:hypothetical protein
MAKIRTRQKAERREEAPDWYFYPATYAETRWIDPKLLRPRERDRRGRFIRRPTWRT